MGKDPADDTLASDEVDDVFALTEPPDDPPLDEEPESLDDELLDSAADAPLVEPLPTPRKPREPTSGLTRAFVFFGVVVTLLLGVQTWRSFWPEPAPFQIAPAPSVVVAPVKPAEPVTSPEDTAARTAEIQRTLQQMRDALSRGLYEDVVRLLEPIANDPGRLDRDQRWQADILLAKAYRSLDNVAKAQEYTLRATDQMIERRAPAQTIEYASELARTGRHAEARTELMKLLARRDGFTRKEEPYLSFAEARVADAWYAQARQSGHLAPLPGVRSGPAPSAAAAAGSHR